MSTKQLEKEATSKKKHKQTKEKPNKDVRKSSEEATKSSSATREIKRQKRLEKKEAKRKNKKPRRRIFPIWLRIIVVIVLCALALILGAMIGHGILGDGKPTDALKIETWQHIIDIVVEEK